MIARVWSARASSANAVRYAAHLREAVVPELRRFPGYTGATLLEGRRQDDVEIVVITWWRSLEDIRAFAGDDAERAIVTDEARAMLTSADDRVRHFHVTLEHTKPDDPVIQ